MYTVYLTSLVLEDKSIPVLVALLHLLRSMFEKPAAGLVSFGTYGLRRGMLRPFVQAVVPAVLGYCCRFNTLLREECIRTLQFLA